MKKILPFIFLSSLFLAAAPAQQIKTITIENTLSEPVYYLYMSPLSDSDWGEDRLGDDILESGDSIEIEVEFDSGSSLFKLLAEDESEQTYRIDSLDLTSASEIQITEEDFLPFGGRHPVEKTLSFTNNTSEDIYYLYVSSNTSMYWGEDILGDEILEINQTYTATLPIDSDYPQHDVLAEGESGTSYERMELNLLEQTAISFTDDDIIESGDDYAYDDDYDDYYDEDEYDSGFMDGYKEGFREAWKEAYKAGFEDAMREARE